MAALELGLRLANWCRWTFKIAAVVANKKKLLVVGPSVAWVLKFEKKRRSLREFWTQNAWSKHRIWIFSASFRVTRVLNWEKSGL